jgi:hypothetical protein
MTYPHDEIALERIKAAARAGKITFADGTKVDQYAREVQLVLNAIAALLDEPELAEAWVSDQSYPSDFALQDEHYPELVERLGVPAGPQDYLWQIAQRLAERQP